MRLRRGSVALVSAMAGASVAGDAGSVRIVTRDPVVGVELEQVFEAVGGCVRLPQHRAQHRQ